MLLGKNIKNYSIWLQNEKKNTKRRCNEASEQAREMERKID